MALSSAASAPRLGAAPGEAGRSRSALGTLALTLPALLLLLLLFVLPLGRLFALSFAGGSLEWYAKALTGGLYTTILLLTFEIAAIVTICCLVIGYPVAFLLATTTPAWRAIGFAFVMLPLWTSVLVRTYAWMVLLGRNGIINRLLIDTGLMDQPLPMLNSKMAVVLGMVHVMLPFMILPIYSAVTRIDPDLPKAARGLGASTLRVVTTIYLPLTSRGILAGVTLVFVVSLGFYITPALLGGGKVLMFAMVIEQQVREFLAWNFASALSVILLAVTLLAFWLLNQGVARRLGD